MARVDPEDDSIERFIVRHYRYDPQRRERRHVVMAAFDNEREFWACLEGVHAEIRSRREAGEPVDPREHASGTVHEPGYLRRAANGHLVTRAIRHGAAGRWIEALELPSNMSVARAQRRPRASDDALLPGRPGSFACRS
ncbi:MAG TPA: hypothetical protein VH589_18460 [Trebonia sp.]|jgi:hypothetical protein